MKPCNRFSLCWTARMGSRTAERLNMTGISRENRLEDMGNGIRSPQNPSTMRRLKRLLPIIFPTRMFFWRWRIAARHEASSGRDVPIAVKVKPITRSLTPKWRAISTAPLMKKFEPIGRNPRPIIMKSMMGGREFNARVLSSWDSFFLDVLLLAA